MFAEPTITMLIARQEMQDRIDAAARHRLARDARQRRRRRAQILRRSTSYQLRPSFSTG